MKRIHNDFVEGVQNQRYLYTLVAVTVSDNFMQQFKFEVIVTRYLNVTLFDLDCTVTSM